MSASDSEQEPGRPLPTLVALPGRVEDGTVAFHRCLADLVELLDADLTPAATEGRSWQLSALEAIRRDLLGREHLPDVLFEPLIRAGVYDPDPSFSRHFIDPAVAAFGRRRVQTALLGILRNGTNLEKAGAASAWYWTRVSLIYRGKRDFDAGTPTPESQAEYDAVADLRAEWQETALREFVSNEDIDVRRRILPGLILNAARYPTELQPMVVEAVRIARTHPDEYLRHRVEIQIADQGDFGTVVRF